MIVTKNATNVSVSIRIVDSTAGTPETGVTSATTGLALEYRRDGAASTAITESDLTALTDAHSDGGMLEIANGYYRLDVPDAAFAAGADKVLVHGTATDMIVFGPDIDLVDTDLRAKTTIYGACVTGTLTATSFTTNIHSGNFTLTTANALVGRTLIFGTNTTTAALEGQAGVIISQSSSGLLGFAAGAFSTNPANTDSFVIV